MTLGEKIKMCRLEAGMTQTALGDILDLTNSCISHWENDDYEPNKSQIDRLCGIFNRDSTYFYPEEENVENFRFQPIRERVELVEVPEIAQLWHVDKLSKDPDDIYLLFRHAGRRWLVFKLYPDYKWETDTRIEDTNGNVYYTNSASCFFLYEDGMKARFGDGKATPASMSNLESDFCRRFNLSGSYNDNAYKNLYEDEKAKHRAFANTIAEALKDYVKE